MPTQQAKTWHHSNKYSADAACEHCEGVVRHEPGASPAAKLCCMRMKRC